MLWGFTPAIDFLEQTKCHFKSFDNFVEVNILIVGCLDPRHVLKTIAQRYRDEKEIKINFYLIEICMEVVARQLLLMTIALEPGDKLGLREKARLYMEVFGNTLLRPASSIYVINKTVQFIRCVTDLDFLKRRLPFVKLNKLKYKERDTLENIFKFWQKEKFKITKLWDLRLRHALGTRYDYRDGAFDWDYHMKLKEIKGCDVINPREYIKWRETGVAFTWLETEFSVPNPTFAVGVTQAGDKLLNFGYHGDIQFSPYFTFGIECPDKDMLKTVNSVYAHRSTDLIQRNLMRIFYEIEYREAYIPEPRDSDTCLGTIIAEIGDINIEDTYEPPEPNRDVEDYWSLPIDHTVTYLPLKSLTELSTKPEFKETFDVVYLSQALIGKTGNIMNTAKDNSVLIVETQKAFFTLKQQEQEKFSEKINKFAEENGCELLFEYNSTEDYYAYYKKKLLPPHCEPLVNTSS